MAQRPTESNNSQPTTDGNNLTKPEEKLHLLESFLNSSKTPAAAISSKDAALPPNLSASEKLVPFLTFLQAPQGEFINEKIKDSIIKNAKDGPMYTKRTGAGPSFEYSAVNPPGLYERPRAIGGPVGNMEANPPQPHRFVISCSREAPSNNPNLTCDVMWYGGLVHNSAGNELYEFSARDTYGPNSHALTYRMVHYNHKDGKGLDIKFQGLPAPTSNDSVGKDVQSIHVHPNEDGKTFDVNLISYPIRAQISPVPGGPAEIGYLPIRFKIVVDKHGQPVDQKDDNGQFVKYKKFYQLQDFHSENDPTKAAWKAPFPQPWWKVGNN